MNTLLRIGTWNMAAEARAPSLEFLNAMNADVYLLTEAPEGAHLPGFERVNSRQVMPKKQHCAAVFTRPGANPVDAGHDCSVAASRDGITFLSSVLPWRSAQGSDGFAGATQGERTETAVAGLGARWPAGDVVWGGDWNHTLAGPVAPGSRLGTSAIHKLLADKLMQVPTASMGCFKGDRSVNHIAVPADWIVTKVERHVADVAGRRLSDHDAYVVEARRGSR